MASWNTEKESHRSRVTQRGTFSVVFVDVCGNESVDQLACQRNILGLDKNVYI